MAKEKIGEIVKFKFMAMIKEFLESREEEVLRVKSGTYSIPWAVNGEEGYINLTFSIPKGERHSDGYDGYYEAQCYEEDLKKKAAKKAEEEKKKKAKIERDKKLREEKRLEKERKKAEMEKEKV